VLYECVGAPSKEGGQPYEQHGTPYAKFGMLYPNVGMLYPNVGMLSLFAGTPSEGGEEIREESRGPRALPPLPDRFWREPQRRAERPSAGQTTRRKHVGMPSLRVGMPSTQRGMPSMH
jgi:hypothetical protein